MSATVPIYRGVVRGKTIELASPTDLPDGQEVSVAIQPAIPGAGIRSSAGAWADAGPDLDAWLSQLDRARHSGRSLPASPS